MYLSLSSRVVSLIFAGPWTAPAPSPCPALCPRLDASSCTWRLFPPGTSRTCPPCSLCCCSPCRTSSSSRPSRACWCLSALSPRTDPSRTAPVLLCTAPSRTDRLSRTSRSVRCICRSWYRDRCSATATSSCPPWNERLLVTSRIWEAWMLELTLIFWSLWCAAWGFWSGSSCASCGPFYGSGWRTCSWIGRASLSACGAWVLAND